MSDDTDEVKYLLKEKKNSWINEKNTFRITLSVGKNDLNWIFNNNKEAAPRTNCLSLSGFFSIERILEWILASKCYLK